MFVSFEHSKLLGCINFTSDRRKVAFVVRVETFEAPGHFEEMTLDEFAEQSLHKFLFGFDAQSVPVVSLLWKVALTPTPT